MGGAVIMRPEEQAAMDAALCGLGSPDDDEVLATLWSIMSACGRLQSSIVPLMDHDRFMIDLITRLVDALRERVCPQTEGRLH